MSQILVDGELIDLGEPRVCLPPDPMVQQVCSQRKEQRPIADLEAEIAQLKDQLKSAVAIKEEAEALSLSRAKMVDSLNISLAGRDKAIALLNAGMESQCELMDGLKQDNRRLRLELDTWRTSG